MKRILLIALLILFIPSMMVYADPLDFDEMTGCQSFDFTSGEHGWVIEASRGTYSAGVGFVATLITSTNPRQKIVQIARSFDDVVIDEVVFTYSFSQGQVISPPTQDTRFQIHHNGIANVDLFADSTNVTDSYSWDESSSGGLLADKVLLRVFSGSTPSVNPSPQGTVTITAADICGAEAETVLRPLESQHEDDWGVFQWEGMTEPITPNNDHVVYNLSTAPGAPVHNAIEFGTVVTVEQLDMPTCFERFGFTQLTGTEGLLGNIGCPVPIPADIHGSGDNPFVYVLQRDFGNLADQFTGLQVKGAYIVQVKDIDNVIWEYIVSNPQVEEGDIINKGCIIGKTMKLHGAGNSIPLIGQLVDIVNFISGDATQGFASLSKLVEDNPVEVYPELVEYPAANSVCNTPPEYEDCVGDSQLGDSEQWDVQGNVSWLEPGVHIGAQSSIRSVYNLDGEREPKMKVSARVISGSAQMGLRIGLTSQTFTVSTQFQDYEIPGDAHEASNGLFYDIVISNDSTTALEIKFVCITFTLDEEGDPEPPPQPDQCYFENYSFNEGTGSWTVSNPGTGVYTYSGREGEILVKDNQTFEQDVALYPVDGSTPQDYVVRVEAALYHYPSYTISPSNTTSTVEIEYNYDGAGYASMGTATYADFANQDNVIVFEDTLEVSADSDGAFIFRVQTVSQPSEVEAISIHFACVDTDTGEDFPGYGGEDEEPDSDPFPEDCEEIERPSGSAVHVWLQWHWANLNGFFQCDLMIFLNTQYKTIQTFFKTVTWSIRWGQSLAILSVDWASSDLLPWLGGYLANASGGAVVYSEGSGDDSCDWWNIVCHLENALSGAGDLFEGLFNLLSSAFEDVIQPLIDAILSLLNKLLSFVFGALKDIMETIINVIIEVVSYLFDLLVSLRNIATNLIDLWNDTEPETLPGMPNCDVSSDNVMCWVYFVAENTVLKEGTTGELIIPLIAALAWIILFFWVLSQILSLMRSSSNAI